VKALLLALFASAALAQPAKPVRLIVPFPPGGTADALSRLAAERMAPLLGQQIVVENRAGAGGNLGAEQVFRAEPDGSTLLASPPHLLTINPLLYKLNFDPAKFVPVGIIATYPNVLVASSRVPATTLDELITLAQANPGKLSIASQGNGTISHLSAELLKKMAGIDLLHVPYKGTAPALTDLLGGQVDVMFDNLITMMPHVKSGKLKLLGAGGAGRIAAFPEVPASAFPASVQRRGWVSSRRRERPRL
jgi:tripartite-type tricarboxylate transporter receptor subunit TctC